MQVLEQCQEALSELPPVETLAKASAPPALDDVVAAGALAGTPEDIAEASRARLAARVLLGERNVLETCIAVWEKEAAAAGGGEKAGAAA